MARHRNSKTTLPRFRKTFEQTIGIVRAAFGRRAFRTTGGLNAAIFDSVMVGLARRLNEGPIESLDDVREAYEGLLASPDFTLATQTGTSQEQNVRMRLHKATEAFSTVI
jgi:hypothetical protein